MTSLQLLILNDGIMTTSIRARDHLILCKSLPTSHPYVCIYAPSLQLLSIINERNVSCKIMATFIHNAPTFPRICALFVHHHPDIKQWQVNIPIPCTKSVTGYVLYSRSLQESTWTHFVLLHNLANLVIKFFSSYLLFRLWVWLNFDLLILKKNRSRNYDHDNHDKPIFLCHAVVCVQERIKVLNQWIFCRFQSKDCFRN